MTDSLTITGTTADAEFLVEVYAYNSATGGRFVKLPNAPIDYNIRLDYLEPTWTFEFTFSAHTPETYSQLVTLTSPFSRIQIFINGIGIMNGICWTQRLGGGENTLQVRFSGTDYRSQLVDASIDTSIKIKKGEDLAVAVKKVCEPIGIFAVDYGDAWVEYLSNIIDTKATSPGGSETVEDEKPSPNESIFEFVNKICRKAGRTILPGPDMNTISLTYPNYSATPFTPITLRLYPVDSGQSNNILDLEIIRDYANVPTYCASYGSITDTKLLTALKKSIKVTDPVEKLLQEAKATKSATKSSSATFFPFNGITEDVKFMRTNIIEDRVVPGTREGQEGAEIAKIYRPMIISDKQSKSQKQLSNKLQRSVVDRFKDTFIVEAVVKGHGPERAFIYTPDLIVNVDDQVHGVQEIMWVKGVEFQAGQGSGPKTRLTLYRDKAIQLGGDE
jgi:prophage tail gpP-like protein